MRLIVTSVIRRSLAGEPTGLLFAIDRSVPRVVRTYAVPPPLYLEHNLNPRGGLRGGRGVSVCGDRIYVANASHVWAYDAHWRLTQCITHPSCANIHGILAKEDRLWVTSTRNGLCCEFSQTGEMRDYFDYRQYEDICRRIGVESDTAKGLGRKSVLSGDVDFRDPRTHRLEVSDAVHLNGLCFLPNGDMLLSFGQCNAWQRTPLLGSTKKVFAELHGHPLISRTRQVMATMCNNYEDPRTGYVADLFKARSAVVRVRGGVAHSVPLLHDGAIMPNHDLVPKSDGTVLRSDTNAKCVICFDPCTGVVLKRIEIGGKFVRGMALLSEDTVVVGAQNEIAVVDIVKREVRGRLRLTQDQRVAVFDIGIVPEEFEPFPDSLQS